MMPSDEQEALSIIHASYLLLVPLSSGRWAVFRHIGGQDVEFMEKIDESQLREISAEKQQEWTRRQARPQVSASGTLGYEQK